MKNIKSEIRHRALCEQRDKEFLALFNPTLDAFLGQGMPMSKARREAAEFTIANGHPHYHVDMDRAYRCVCHLLAAEKKKAANAREITSHVARLQDKGMSVEQALEHVLEHCRASRFFISPATALTKICPKSRSRVRTLR